MRLAQRFGVLRNHVVRGLARLLGLLGSARGWLRRHGRCCPNGSRSLRLGRVRRFAWCLVPRASFFQGRFEGGVVVDEAEVDENFANDIVQLLERVAGYLRAEAFAVCAQIAVLSHGMHGADDGFVVDIADEAVVVHLFEKGFARIIVVGNGTINERDDVLQRGSRRCAALRRKRQRELLSCIAGFEQL